MRLFVAINFNNDTRAKLLTLRDELQSRSQRGNFSAPENLHLTLAFLGECDDRQISLAKQIVSATKFEPFELTIGGFGKFTPNKPDICYAGVMNTPNLFAFQRNLYDNLCARGFKLDNRKFWPHITLGREVVLRDISKTTSDVHLEPLCETVSTIELMKSERISGKLTYTAIARSGI